MRRLGKGEVGGLARLRRRRTTDGDARPPTRNALDPASAVSFQLQTPPCSTCCPAPRPGDRSTAPWAPASILAGGGGPLLAAATRPPPPRVTSEPGAQRPRPRCSAGSGRRAPRCPCSLARRAGPASVALQTEFSRGSNRPPLSAPAPPPNVPGAFFRLQTPDPARFRSTGSLLHCSPTPPRCDRTAAAASASPLSWFRCTGDMPRRNQMSARYDAHAIKACSCTHAPPCLPSGGSPCPPFPTRRSGGRGVSSRWQARL